MAPASRPSPQPPTDRPGRLCRAAVMLVVTLGFGLNVLAWSLIHPLGEDPWGHLDVGARMSVALMCAPVVVGSLGQIPVGMLADRYGARLVLPAVSLATAAAVFVFATARSLPVVIAAACALGVGGTAFAAGAPLVTSMLPLGRRGFGLSLYGAGMIGAAAASLATARLVGDYGQRELLTLVAALVAGAAVTVLVVRVRPSAPEHGESALRLAWSFMRLPATRHLAAWYAVAAGGVVAFALYLPSYLSTAYRLDWSRAVLITAAAIGTVAAARPLGGSLASRRDPIRLLAGSYTAVAALTVLFVLEPSAGAAIATLLAIAAALGVAGGVVLALIGRTVPAGRTGIITGTVCAVGGLAGMIPPLLLAAAHARTGSYTAGWTILAGLALATATHLRSQPGWMGAALAFPAVPAASSPTTSVVSLAAADAARNTQGVLSTLGALATLGDLTIVYGDNGGPGLTPYAIAAGLRSHLPQRAVVTLYVGERIHPTERAMIAEMLDDGVVVLVHTTTGDLDTVATRLTDRLGASQLLRLTDGHIAGFRQVSLPWPAGAGAA